MHMFQSEIKDNTTLKDHSTITKITTMKYQAIDNNLFIENRKKFKNSLKPNSLAIFVSNDIMPTTADGSIGFRQNADLF